MQELNKKFNICCPHCNQHIADLSDSIFENVFSKLPFGEFLNSQPEGTEVKLIFDVTHHHDGGCNKPYRITFKGIANGDGHFNHVDIDVELLKKYIACQGTYNENKPYQ